MVHLTAENFKDFINSNEVVIVDFWATWCGPCRMLTPVLEELETKISVKIGKVNVDEEREIAGAFGIQSIPTLLAFKDGKIIDKRVGYQPLEMLSNWVTALNK